MQAPPPLLDQKLPALQTESPNTIYREALHITRRKILGLDSQYHRSLSDIQTNKQTNKQTNTIATAIMPQNLAHKIPNTLSLALLQPDVIHNQLNPVRLAVAAECYRIQSQTLRIPDRYGLFSPGPARLQVYQAGRCMVLFFSLGYLNVAAWAPSIALLVLVGGEAGRVVLVLGAVEVLVVVAFWVAMCRDRRRRLGFVWWDWNERRD
ncbi:hypothetical protein F4814DRAFT_402144 [Daldinia grandis]|nr:hypothetical protein F4814DRAFT_402144 [Daldinia grandis]